jgi:NitT/TauT family transport system substrate-binding protein
MNQKKCFATLIVLAMGLVMVLTTVPVLAEDTHAHNVINIGYQPSTHQLAFMTAYQKGFYNETLAPLGVEEVKAFNFPTGAPEIQAMLAGDLDFAYVGSAPFVTGVATGLDAKIIASVNVQGSDLVVKKDLEYTSPEDLKGLKIATFPAGTIQDTILRDWLKANGLDADNDVEIVAMGPGDATTAMIAGKIDAAFLPHPSPLSIEEAGAGKIVVHSGEMESDHSCCVLIASGEMIKNHPDIVEQVLKTHLRATEYNEANLGEAAQYMNELTGLKTDIITKSLEQWDGEFVSDPTRIIKSVTTFATIQKELGYIKADVTEKELFDTSFWNKVSS